jgi:carbon monoxide dehydrogenase subunit G
VSRKTHGRGESTTEPQEAAHPRGAQGYGLSNLEDKENWPVELTHEFEIGSPVGDVWAKLLDLRNVAAALPGASVDDVESDGTHHGTLRLKLGSFVASFRGTARYTEVDPSEHRVVLDARGNSSQGQASVGLVGRALPGNGPESTKVQLTSTVLLSGRIANFGASLASDVARQVLDQFAANLTVAFESAGAERPAPAGTDAAPARPQAAPAPVADALDVGSVLVPAWLTRPVPLPVALALAVSGLVLGRALSRGRRGPTIVVHPSLAGVTP